LNYYLTAPPLVEGLFIFAAPPVACRRKCYFAAGIKSSQRMIQRIQSVWLLLAAVATGLLFKMAVYGGELTMGGVKELLVSQSYLLFIVVAVLTLFQLGAIFMFKKRSNQKKLILLSILLQLVLVALIWMEVGDFVLANSFKSSVYKPGAVLPLLSVVLLVLAYRGIRRDEKLIKAAERLR
jgi:hypothetical protein